MGNEVLNIFHLTIFSKKATFSEKTANKNMVGHDNFLGDGVILRQNEYNIFYHKLNVKYFHIRQFFWKK